MNGSIRLHKDFGVNATMPLCIICNKEKGEIALLGAAYKGEAPMHMVIDIEPCKECREKYLSKGVMLAEAEVEYKGETKRHVPNGNLLVIKEEAFKILFNVPVPTGKIAFVEFGMLDTITKIVKSNE